MRLRTALRINALFSTVSGITAVVLAGPISDLFEIDPGWVLGVGAGLIPFGIGIGAFASRDTIERGIVMQIVAADVAWVVAAVVLILIPGVIAPGGKVLLAAVSTVVAVLARAQGAALDEASRVRS